MLRGGLYAANLSERAHFYAGHNPAQKIQKTKMFGGDQVTIDWLVITLMIV